MSLQKHIHFLHRNKAYCPEIYAYKDILTERGFDINIFNNKSEISSNLPGIEWHIMGYDFTSRQHKDSILIHEYHSVPVNKSSAMSKLKLNIKRAFNKKPDLRIFLNEFVKSEFNFNDDVRFLYRDMGIQSSFLSTAKSSKEYDFVYLGNMDSVRDVHSFVSHFNVAFPNKKLVLIGRISERIKGLIAENKNITAVGEIDHFKVPEYLAKSEYGINYIPNKYPFYNQTSTKLLEYCALDLKIISIKYKWVEEFMKSRNARFFLFDDFSEFNESVFDFDYVTPDLSDLEWTKIIKKSGIINYLEELF